MLLTLRRKSRKCCQCEPSFVVKMQYRTYSRQTVVFKSPVRKTTSRSIQHTQRNPRFFELARNRLESGSTNFTIIERPQLLFCKIRPQ